MIVFLIAPEQSPTLELASILARHGCSVMRVDQPGRAVDQLQTLSSDVVISDLSATGDSGVALLSRSVHICPDAMRVAVVAPGTPEVMLDAVNTGQAHLILPTDDMQHGASVLLISLERHQRELRSRRETQEQLTEWTRCLETRVADANATVDQALDDLLLALVTALDLRENESGGHSRRVALYTLFLASSAGIDPGLFEDIYRGALLHDVGKIGIDDAVLLKPGGLTCDERDHMERHVAIGVRMLSEVGILQSSIYIPQYHHEHYDGLGYPAGLRGENIPLPARLFALIDVYDALRSERPYKGPMSHEAALQIIREESGTHFDPTLVKAFVDIREATWHQLSHEAKNIRSFSEALICCQRVHTSMDAESAEEQVPVA